MPILQRTLSFENDAILNHLSSVEIEVEFPRFSFRYTGNGIQRFVSGVEKYSTIHNLKDKEYSLHLPLTRMVGLDLKDICGFFLYHFIEIMNPDRNINEFSIPFVVHIKDMSGQRITSMEFEGLLYEEKSVSIDYDENRYERELSKFESVYGSKEIEDLNVAGLQHLASAKDKSVFIINKSSFESLPQLLNGADQTVVSSHIVLELVEIFHSMTKINPILKGGGDVLLYELQSFSERTQVTFDQSFTGNLETLTSELFDFPLELPIVQSVIIKGVFELVSESNIKISDLDFYDLSIEYPQFSGLPKIVEYNWSVLDNMPTSNSVEFAFSDENTIVTNQVNGLITVRVKGYDGAVLWEENFLPTDDRLSNITIKIKKYPENDIVVDNSTGKPKSIKRLRGKVLQNKDKHDLNELTIIVRALKAEEEEYKIVSAAKTDKSGNFSMDYPYGKFTGAHALVSLMPNSPANIKINLNGKNESISDDFIYLLLTDEVVTEAENAKHSEEDCDCHTPQKAKRLPDQIDLIESDEYTQDIGGACLNLSTPNRTLNEYSYNAIVRISDPDVSNYVLNKVIESDGKVNYKLIGEGKTLSRKEVNLNNPIRWQDAPEANSDLSLYQAVTIATGHILYFKSVYKADGYSLGDLVYSLPLAPGQKKQIVVFESSHSLMGAESQAVSQGESLSAGLVSDRFITDEISGSLGENLSGRSKAHTSGMSMGLGASGSYGGIGASLGIAGGFSNSNSSATQNSSRNISQFFGEKLRQSLLQNAESYRQLNASVVTTVTEGQEYGVTSEVIANHNHCHSMTMMYFEVLRHYAIFQEVSHVEECVFVPLLMTHFSTENIHKWKDIFASNLLPMPSNTYLSNISNIFGIKRHPLLKAFDANERIKTDYSRVDFPEESYAEDEITYIKGRFTMNVNLPRPKTKYDRIKSFPIRKKTETKSNDHERGLFAMIPGVGFFLAAGVEDETKVKYYMTKIIDQFISIDDNFDSVPPAQAIRVVTFSSQIVLDINGFPKLVPTHTIFEDGHIDKEIWETYAKILDYTGDDGVAKMLNYYFSGRLISEWDAIFNNDMLPEIFTRIIDSLSITYDVLGVRNGLNLDFSIGSNYTGGNKRINVDFNSTGATGKKRSELPQYIKVSSNNEDVKALNKHVQLNLGQVVLNYETDHFRGTLFQGYINNDLLDDVSLYIPLTSRDKRNPKKEDEYLVKTLIEHLNSNLEHYNKLLWRNLDPDRRYMLLDGFSIQTYTASGHKAKMRSLASVVKNELITITGNSLVFPVSDGYRVGRDSILEEIGDDVVQEVSLIELYKPLTPVPPYRVSVPTRGVFMEAIMGQCDACEMVKENSSQDWDKFKTEEPTSIQPIITPTPTVTEYKPTYKDFAQPLVNIQNAPDAPAPGVGLTQLNELLGKAGAFNDITGLAKNQDNAIETFKANTAAAQKYAEMASSLAKQQHNTQNSEEITDGIKKAKQDGHISDEDVKNLTRQHLQQQIDGGETEKNKLQNEKENSRPSLIDKAFDNIDYGQSLQAEKIDSDGTKQSVDIQHIASFSGQKIELSANASFTNIWSWTRARMPYNNELRKQGISRIKNTRITDVVFHLNSMFSPNTFEFLDNRSQANIISSIRTTIDELQAENLNLNVHLMFFPRPNINFIKEAVAQLITVVNEFNISSVLFDAEGNWRQAGDHQLCVDYLKDNFKNQIGNTRLGFTDTKLEEKGVSLASICDYVMPQAYSTTGGKFNDGHLRRPGEMQMRIYESFSRLNIPIIFILVAYDLQRPQSHPNASDYETMAYTINRILEIENYYPNEVAYWTLPNISHNSEIERFIKELKVAIV